MHTLALRDRSGEEPAYSTRLMGSELLVLAIVDIL